jgi:hypothetical protein
MDITRDCAVKLEHNTTWTAGIVNLCNHSDSMGLAIVRLRCRASTVEIVTACAMRCAYDGQHVKCLECAVTVGARLQSERRLPACSAQVTVNVAQAFFLSLLLGSTRPSR